MRALAKNAETGIDHVVAFDHLATRSGKVPCSMIYNLMKSQSHA